MASKCSARRTRADRLILYAWPESETSTAIQSAHRVEAAGCEAARVAQSALYSTKTREAPRSGWRRNPSRSNRRLARTLRG